MASEGPVKLQPKGSELPYRLLWEAITDAVVVIDQRSSIRYANQAVRELFGYRPEELVGRSMAMLQPERLRSAHSGGIALYLKTGERRADWRSMETEGLHRQGHDVPLEISLGEIQIDGSRMFVAVLRDISSRRRSEDELNTAVSQLSATLESTTDGILVVGLDDRITRFNQRFVEMWNIPREILDTRDDEIALGFVLAQLTDPSAFIAKVEALKVHHLEESFDTIKFKDGRVYERFSRPQMTDGKAIGRVWSFRDVTSRGRSEAMQAALHKISEAAHTTPDLQALFQRVHEIISELLPAKNFYVALYDERSDLVSFPYFVDEFDPTPEACTLKERGGLTEVVLRSGEPLLLSPAAIDGTAAPPGVKEIGTAGLDWLGVPLKTRCGTIGMLAVQSYSDDVRYAESDKELLHFVSDQVAAAIESKQAQQAIGESEARFHSVFDQSPIIICLLSYPEGRILEINAAGLVAFGLCWEEVIGRTTLEINVWADQHDRKRFLQLLGTNGEVHQFEAKMRRRNGKVLTVLLSGNLMTLGDRTYNLTSLQDISERKLAEQWQKHYADTLALIMAEAPTGTVLESLALFAERHSEGMLCSILVLSPDGKRLLSGAAPSLPAFYNQAIDGVLIGPDVGSCGAAAFTGRIVITEDVTTHPNWIPWRELAVQAGFRSSWSHPVLSAENQVLGTFAVYRREPCIPSAAEIELIRQSASLAGVALERAQHHEGRRLAKVVFEHSIEGLMVTDFAGRVLMVNQSFESLTGFSAEEVVGRSSQILDSGRQDAALEAERLESLASSGRWQGEMWGKKKSGETYPLAISIATVNDSSGAPSHYISSIADVSAQKVQAARIEQLAFYDVLTELPNRALFLDRLEQTLAAAERSGGGGAILFIDLDRFKEINDTQGHAVGDLALAEVARRFQHATRKEETLARLGGDEFVLIAENADQKTAVRIATRLQRSLVEPLELMGHSYSLSASIGIAFYPADGQTSEDLIKRTGIAMYRAKSSGGGYRMYQSQMGAELEKRLDIAERLAKAMEASRLQLHYQPQIDLGSGRLIGAEALLRWNDPELGWISPAEFIPIAEERGMMGSLGEWVLGEACRQVVAWAEMGARLEGTLAINVSALQIEATELADRLLEIVRAASLSPELFELELTESSMMVNPERAVQMMALLGAAGFSISIDDFGTGYSSLSYLKRFAADQIKIDISFVRNMLTDANDKTIVTAIIAMARSLGMKTTAEGVEEAGQAAALLSLGCDYAQGYHFGRPEPAQAFMERWLKPSTTP